MPLLGNYQSAPFNPFNLLFIIFPNLRFLDIVLLLKLTCLGVFCYFLALELGLSSLSATASALIICFSGFISQNINHINLNVDLWLPAGLLMSEKILKNRGTLIGLIILILITALAFLAGNPQASFFFLLFILSYSIVRGGFQKKREILIIILGTGLGILLSSVQLLSFIEYLGFSWHYHSPAIHSFDYLPARHFFTLFFPWLFGPFHTNPELFKLPGYLGLIPVFLAILTLPKIKTLQKSALFFWIYSLVFWGLIYNLPLFSLLNYLPVLNLLRTAKHVYFGICLCLSLLSGFGLDYFRKNSFSFRDYAISLGMIFFTAILSLSIALLFPFKTSQAPVSQKAWIIPLVLLLLTGLVGLGGIVFNRRSVASLIIGVFAWINLLYLSPGLSPNKEIAFKIWRYKNPEPPAVFFPILQDSNPSRMVGIENATTPNINVLFKINDLRAFDGIYPRSYAEKMAEIKGLKMEELFEQYVRDGWWFMIKAENLSHSWLDPLGVKYIISENPLNLPELMFVGRAEGYYFYENPGALPRVRVQYFSGRLELQGARIEEYKPDCVKIILSAEDASELVLADQYAPGWRAFNLSSGSELRILKEQGLFRKVAIEKGMSEIVFYYQPWGFRIGLFFSLSALFALMIATALSSSRLWVKQ